MVLLDSDVIIAHLRGHDAAREWLLHTRRDSGRPTISAVSIGEVAGGMRSAERLAVARLLSSFTRLAVTERIAWCAAELARKYRRSHGGIGVADYLIAATADVEGLELATLNVRHFPMFDGLTAPFAW